MRAILILAIPGLLVCFLVFKPQPALADDGQGARVNENASENRQANQGNGAQTSFNNSQNSATTSSGLASTTPPTLSQTASSSATISTSTGSGAAALITTGTSTPSTGTTTLITASTTATSASTSLSYASSSDSNATTSQNDDEEEYIDDGIYFYLFEDEYEDEEGDSGHSMSPRIYSGKRTYEKGEIGVIFGTYLHPISTYNMVIFKYFDGKPSEKEVITVQADAVGNIYSLYTMDSDAEYYRVYLTSYDGYPLDRTWFWVGEDE